MIPFNKTQLSLLISAATLALAVPSYAQNATDDQADTKNAKFQLEEEEILVTATRRDESMSDIPMNISAMGEAELRERNIGDLKDFLKDSVSIHAPENSARSMDSVTVRGLSISPVNQNDLEYFVRSTVAYYIDDTPVHSMGYRIKDVRRVETLMGPQGTLYGGGSLGGAIRYITNQPEYDETTVDVRAGTYQTQGGGLSVDTDVTMNLPLAENLAVRANIAYLDEAGYTDRMIVTAERLNDPMWDAQGKQVKFKNDDWQRVNSAKVALAWQPADNMELTLTHIEQNQRANGSRGTAVDGDYAVQYDKNVVVGYHREFSDREFTLDSLSFEWDLGFAGLVSNTSNYEYSRTGQNNYPNGYTYYGDWGNCAVFCYSNNYDSAPYMTFDNVNSAFTHETRLVSNTEGAISWIGGVYYTEQKGNLRFWEWYDDLEAGLWGLPTNGDNGYFEDINTDYTELAVYGEVTWDVTEDFHVTGGVRWFDWEDNANPKVVDYAFELVDYEREVNNGDQDVFYKLNLSYDITDSMLTYATFSQGFRRGGVNGFKDHAGETVTEEAQTYQPDSIDNLELGLKGKLFDDRLYVQLSAYQMKWYNTQTYRVQTIDAGFPLNGTANGPDAVTEGIETAIRYRITDNWSVKFSTSNNEAKWANTKTHCLYESGDECRTWEKGGKFGGTPAFAYNLSVSYNTVLPNGLGFRAGLHQNYRDEIQSDRADSPDDIVWTYPEITRYNASVGVNGDQWGLSLWASNLTNEEKLVSFQRGQGASVGHRDIYSQPRTIGTSVSFHF
ncbi:TonB-dependent receptor [Simiduia sp. 21SJ11W-1]|uniref:TonB-dependent receptor n=1 Tax=Simiduia sp. 21SJ11W-1 TaxID=2909669 RepID=UPI00209DD7BA|nr:TonB-dependent receptor [Simiduia sp. 21SJ11W-1]UTA48372.1 TonB-dependent receptor [Simiduia sp. 21SJ11W-1]